MKAISLTQPWAWIILNLGKRVENRSRNLGNYRGPVLLHAAKRTTVKDWGDAYDFVAERFGEEFAARIQRPWVGSRGRLYHPNYPLGCIVGAAEIVNQCEPGAAWARGRATGRQHEPASWSGDQERWYMGMYAYVLDNVRPLGPLGLTVPCKGALGLWNVPSDVEATVRALLEAA